MRLYNKEFERIQHAPADGQVRLVSKRHTSGSPTPGRRHVLGTPRPIKAGQTADDVVAEYVAEYGHWPAGAALRDEVDYLELV